MKTFNLNLLIQLKKYPAIKLGEAVYATAVPRMYFQSTSGHIDSHLTTPNDSRSTFIARFTPSCCPIEDAFRIYPIVVPHLEQKDACSSGLRVFRYLINSFILTILPLGIIYVNTYRLFTFR